MLTKKCNYNNNIVKSKTFFVNKEQKTMKEKETHLRVHIAFDLVVAVRQALLLLVVPHETLCAFCVPFLLGFFCAKIIIHNFIETTTFVFVFYNISSMV